MFRQKPWLPWWLALVVPVAVALAAVLVSLLPKQSTVPNLKGAANVFAAQKLVNSAGFQLAPHTSTIVDPTKQAGSIADQSPHAGTKVKRGSVVTVAVYTGTGRVVVPSVLGTTPGLADQALRASQLTLGAVSPQPLDPTGKIRSQIPLPGTKVAAGTAVAVFIAPARAGATTGAHNGTGGPTKGAAAAAAGVATPAALAAVAAQAGEGPIAIPPLSGDPTAAAGKLSQLGLVPVPTKRLATVPVGQLAGTVPAAGAKVPKGAQVDLLISSGSPRLAYDDGQAVHVIDPTTGKPSGRVPADAGPDVEASWSPDGTHLVVSDGGRLVLDQPNAPGAAPFALTPPDAGGGGPQSLVRTDHQGVDRRLHPAQRRRRTAVLRDHRPVRTECRLHRGPGMGPRRRGRLVAGRLDDPRAGHPQPRRELRVAGLHQQRPVLDARRRLGSRHARRRMPRSPGQGVFAGAFSPDGKRMALVSNLGSSDFHLYVVPAGTFSPHAGSAAAGARVPGELALGRSGARGHATGRAVQPDRDRDAGGDRSVQSTHADDPRDACRPSPVATGDQWWLTRHVDATARADQLVLVLPDGGRVPIEDRLTIGRADDATIKLDDRTVSRRHARIVPGPDGPRIEDAGSRFGVLVDGEPLVGPRRLEAGVELRLGNVALRVERASPGPWSASPEPRQAPMRRSSCRSARRATRCAAPADGSIRPRLRSGWALKRVADDPGDARYVLRDLRSKAFLRLDEQDARLLSLLDGSRTIGELLLEATSVLGPTGPGRLARLIAEFGDRGLLDGIAATPEPQGEPRLLRRVLEPRERTFESIADWFVRAYRGLGPAVVLPARGDRVWSCCRWPGWSRSPIWSGRGTARRWSSRTVCSSAVWSSSPGASCSSRCTSARTAWRWRTTAGAPTEPGCGW